MQWLDVLSRIVHIGTAITLVGGTVFLRLVLIPAATVLESEVEQTLRGRVMATWKRFVHGGIALFLLSGFYNYMQAIPNHKGDGLYHGLMGTKMLLAFTVFFIASALVGRSSALQRIRDRRTFWMAAVILMTVVIVCISGFLKIRGIVPPDSTL